MTNSQWIKEIWRHRKDVKREPTKYTHTYFWDCIRATVALMLDRWHEAQRGELICDEHNGWRAVAWKNDGTYWTDYGTGHAFTTLVVRGWTVYDYTDGTL